MSTCARDARPAITVYAIQRMQLESSCETGFSVTSPVYQPITQGRYRKCDFAGVLE